jgi:hypothetical protein
MLSSMAFDRRDFFKSLLTAGSGAAMAKKLPESFPPSTVAQPQEIPASLAPPELARAFPAWRPFDLADRRLWCYYDTAELEDGQTIPTQFHMFGAGLGQVDSCGHVKDLHDTNFHQGGCSAFLPGYDMLVQRIGIVFDPDAPGNADLISKGLRLELWVLQRRLAETLVFPFFQRGYHFADCSAYIPPQGYFRFAVDPRMGRVDPSRSRVAGRVKFVVCMSGFCDFPVA